MFRSRLAAMMLAVAVLVLGTARSGYAVTRAEFFEHANFCCSSFIDYGDGGRCYNLPLSWVKRISSVRSDTTYHLYSLPNCWQETGYPDKSFTGDVSYVGDDMNDRTQSVRVY